MEGKYAEGILQADGDRLPEDPQGMRRHLWADRPFMREAAKFEAGGIRP